MASALAVLALIAAAVLGTLVLWRLNEPAVRATIGFVDKLRYVLGMVFLALGAYHFLKSGNPLLIAVAAAGFAFLTGWALVERPWAETI